jgi:hypothetical protein
MSDINPFGRYAMSALCEKQRDGIHGIAYCPICDKAGKSYDPGKGEKPAIIISIGKVRIPMRLIHRVIDGPAVSRRTGTRAG